MTLAPLELPEELVLAEDEHAVHQLDVLVELGGEHDDRQALAGERAEQLVEVVLRADVDAAGRVVEQEDLRAEREPARDDHLLLVAAGQRRDRILRRARARSRADRRTSEADAATSAG